MEQVEPTSIVDEDYLLEAGDIAYKDKELYMALQRKNDANNLLVFGKASPTGLIASCLLFIKLLHYKHGIEYISIYKQHRGWTILNRFHILWENEKQGYARISENMETVDEILERHKC